MNRLRITLAGLALSALAITFVLRPDMAVPSLGLILVCVVQNTMFSLVSRSRNRDNIDYHILASVGSNGVYLLTLKLLIEYEITAWFFVPYVVGTVIGSVTGAKISMAIERVLGATSDGHLSQ